MVRGRQGWGRQGKARQAQTTLRMPRFSDIFVYTQMSGDMTAMLYNDCYLLKAVGEHAAGSKVEIVHFDVVGMVLFFKVGNEVSGPYTLSTSSSVIPATRVDA